MSHSLAPQNHSSLLLVLYFKNILHSNLHWFFPSLPSPHVLWPQGSMSNLFVFILHAFSEWSNVLLVFQIISSAYQIYISHSNCSLSLQIHYKYKLNSPVSNSTCPKLNSLSWPLSMCLWRPKKAKALQKPASWKATEPTKGGGQYHCWNLASTRNTGH